MRVALRRAAKRSSHRQVAPGGLVAQASVTMAHLRTSELSSGGASELENICAVDLLRGIQGHLRSFGFFEPRVSGDRPVEPRLKLWMVHADHLHWHQTSRRPPSCGSSGTCVSPSSLSALSNSAFEMVPDPSSSHILKKSMSLVCAWIG